MIKNAQSHMLRNMTENDLVVRSWQGAALSADEMAKVQDAAQGAAQRDGERRDSVDAIPRDLDTFPIGVERKVGIAGFAPFAVL